MSPQKFSIVKLGLNILKFLVWRRHNTHKFLYFDISLIFLFLFGDILLYDFQLLDGLKRETILIYKLIFHECIFYILDIFRQDLYRLIDRFLHSRSFLFDYFLGFLEIVL